MKRLQLKTSQYRYLVESFKEWLDILGYAETTVESLPVHVRELLHYLETEQKVTTIKLMQNKHIRSFKHYLQTRPNQKAAGGLSNSTINKTILAVNTFNKYLRTTGKHDLDILLRQYERSLSVRTILTREQVRLLYESTYLTRRGAGRAYGQRDRAILSIFYGCGLRRNEGRNLTLSDIDMNKQQLIVRKGKGDKQRRVPFTAGIKEDLQTYIEEGRQEFLERYNVETDALFIGRGNKGMQNFYQRMKLMSKEAGFPQQVGLHTLRHSIATHLLEAGMEIENISKFLGHSSLESTQIYTHIVNKQANAEI